MKIENQEKRRNNTEGVKVENLRVQHFSRTFVGAYLLLDEKKVYVCPLFMINIKKGETKTHKQTKAYRKKKLSHLHISNILDINFL